MMKILSTRTLLPYKVITVIKTIVIIECAIILNESLPAFFSLALYNSLVKENKSGISWDKAAICFVVRDDSVPVMNFTTVNVALKLFCKLLV